MKHEFNKVAILCTTWEQMEKIANEAMKKGLIVSSLSFSEFTRGYNLFRANQTHKDVYSNYQISEGKPVVTYADFIAGMQEPETQVVEVTGCDGCVFLVRGVHEYSFCHSCLHPESDKHLRRLFVDLFTTCPLKKGAVTIKLKN